MGRESGEVRQPAVASGRGAGAAPWTPQPCCLFARLLAGADSGLVPVVASILCGCSRPVVGPAHADDPDEWSTSRRLGCQRNAPSAVEPLHVPRSTNRDISGILFGRFGDSRSMSVIPLLLDDLVTVSDVRDDRDEARVPGDLLAAGPPRPAGPANSGVCAPRSSRSSRTSTAAAPWISVSAAEDGVSSRTVRETVEVARRLEGLARHRGCRSRRPTLRRATRIGGGARR